MKHSKKRFFIHLVFIFQVLLVFITVVGHLESNYNPTIINIPLLPRSAISGMRIVRLNNSWRSFFFSSLLPYTAISLFVLHYDDVYCITNSTNLADFWIIVIVSKKVFCMNRFMHALNFNYSCHSVMITNTVRSQILRNIFFFFQIDCVFEYITCWSIALCQDIKYNIDRVKTTNVIGTVEFILITIIFFT